MNYFTFNHITQIKIFLKYIHISIQVTKIGQNNIRLCLHYHPQGSLNYRITKRINSFRTASPLNPLPEAKGSILTHVQVQGAITQRVTRETKAEVTSPNSEHDLAASSSFIWLKLLLRYRQKAPTQTQFGGLQFRHVVKSWCERQDSL